MQRKLKKSRRPSRWVSKTAYRIIIIFIVTEIFEEQTKNFLGIIDICCTAVHKFN